MKEFFSLSYQRCEKLLLGAIALGTIVLGAFDIFVPNVRGGEFQNLDFEQATVSPTPVGAIGSFVESTVAFPGWSVSPTGTVLSAYTLYNSITLGSPAQVLIGPSFPNALHLTPLHGSYSVMLIRGVVSSQDFPSLKQTGMVPTTANSINFLLGQGQSANVLVTLNGVVIPLFPITGGRLAGDVASFAGQEAELKFTLQTQTLGTGGYCFDDVVFSSEQIPVLSVHPEPGPSSSLDVTLSWSTNLTGFAVESAEVLTSEVWSTVTNAVVLVGEHFTVKVDMAAQQRYFRLHRQ